MQAFGTEPPILSNAPNNEPTVRLLRYSWDLVMARLGTFVGLMAMLLFATVLSAVAYFGVAILQGFNFLQPKPLGPTDLLAAQLAGVLAGAAIVAPVTVGIYGVIFKLLRHEPDPLSGLSAAGKYFIPAATVHIVTGLLTTASMIVCRTLFGPIWSSLPNLLFASIVGFLAFLIVPAVVGLDMKLGDAVGYSMKRVMSQPFSYLGYFIAAELMACLGAFACGFGVVLTGGIAFVAVALLITGIVPTPMVGDPGAYPRYPQAPGY